MSPRFSLRTLLIITTAVALLIGAKKWLFDMYRYTDPGDVVAQVAFQLQIWRDLPLLVVWALGCEWIARRTSTGDPGRRLIGIALALNIVWQLLGGIGMYRLLQYFAPTQLNIATIVVLSVETLVQTTVWALVLVAYVRLYESRPAGSSPRPHPFDG